MRLHDIQQELTRLFFSDAYSHKQSSLLKDPYSALASTLTDNGIALEHRLNIYRNHIILSLQDVLISHFPFVAALAGKDFLKQAAKSYLLNNPPTEACLDRYGVGFPEFLEQADQTRGYPFLPDAARLDWAMVSSKNAAHEDSLTMEDLQQIDTSEYAEQVLPLKQSVQLIQSTFPLDKMYSYAMTASKDHLQDQGKTFAEAPLPDETEPTWLAIARVGWQPHIFKLERADFMLLELLNEQQQLGDALESVIEQYPEFDFAKFWQDYLGLGLFAARPGF